MTTVSVAALVISFLSLLTSFLSFYWNALRSPKYRSAPLRLVNLFQLRGMSAHLGAPIVITNTGARTGVLDRLYMSLTNVPERHTTIFRELLEGLEDPVVPNITDVDGKSAFDAQTFLNRFPKPQAICGGSSAVKYSWFQAESPSFRFRAGDYTLSMYMYCPEKRKPILLVSIPLHLESPIQEDQYRIIADLMGKGLIEEKESTQLRAVGTRLIAPKG